MKKLLLVVCFAALSFTAFAQQDAMYTHYMYNTLGVNPAYAGSREAVTATLLNRSQWVGFKGAPTTQTVTVHSPVYEDKVNLGLSIVNDKIGPTNNTSIFIDYAFRFQLDDESKLALGLKAGVNSLSADLTKLRLDNPDDEAFAGKLNTALTPNFGFGIYYSRDRFYAGLSVPRLLENKYEFNQSLSGNSVAKEQRHYYGIAGAMFTLNEDFDLKPTTLLKVTKGSPIEADFTASFIYQQKLLLGAMYRTGDAMGLLAGLDLNDQLHIGYSFDWSVVNNTAKYNYGSHEIVLRYDFVFATKYRIRSPRYF